MAEGRNVLDPTQKTVSSLALFGGEPAFTEPVHVGRPNIGNRQLLTERINDVLDRRWLTNDGSYVQEFERRIAELVGVEHCIATCNATVALEIAIRALGMTGEVILPSFTFVATAHALQWQGITPVFCDIDPQSHTLDPNKVERLITPKTSGIIAVNLWARACAIEALTEIAKRHELNLLFDSAHALGCSHRGRMIGSFGDAEVFSFHATKFVNSMEGGAVVTNNSELAKNLRLMRNFGFTSYDRTDTIGINGKMNEVSAVMGLTNLESLDDFVAINLEHYKHYRDELRDLNGITVLPYDETERSNYQYVVLEIDEQETVITRDDLIKILHAENILARRYFYPGCHRMEPYRSFYPNAHLDLPQTIQVAARVIVLPTGQAISPINISVVCQIIRTAVENGREIRRLLEKRSA